MIKLSLNLKQDQSKSIFNKKKLKLNLMKLLNHFLIEDGCKKLLVQIMKIKICFNYILLISNQTNNSNIQIFNLMKKFRY